MCILSYKMVEIQAEIEQTFVICKNSLDTDLAQQIVRPDLNPDWLTSDGILLKVFLPKKLILKKKKKIALP